MFLNVNDYEWFGSSIWFGERWGFGISQINIAHVTAAAQEKNRLSTSEFINAMCSQLD